MRVRNGRNTPSAPLSGKVISNRDPVAIAAVQRSIIPGSTSGSWTLCQPQPSISAGVCPGVVVPGAVVPVDPAVRPRHPAKVRQVLAEIPELLLRAPEGCLRGGPLDRGPGALREIAGVGDLPVRPVARGAVVHEQHRGQLAVLDERDAEERRDREPGVSGHASPRRRVRGSSLTSSTRTTFPRRRSAIISGP